jgi:Domain of Unknown Function (DUF748)
VEASTHIVDAVRQEPGRPRARWRKWAYFGLLLLALTFALPRLFAPLVAARVERVLATRVEIGAVTFQPLDAVFTLHHVTVYAPATASAEHAPPLIAERVRIDVQWLPLLHHILQVRELAFESARIDVDRLPDGRFGLANLEPPDPAGELPPGWSFGLDRIAFRNSRLRLRDLGGAATPMEVTLRDAEVSAMRRHGTAFGKATNLRVDGRIGAGQLRAEGHYELREDGLVLDARVRVKDVPLAQLTSYVGDLGWTNLSGRVSGQLRWQREPRRRDLLSGRIILRRGSVRVARVAEPALAVRRAIAEVGAIDLLNRRIAIHSVTLRGATLAVQPEAEEPIPLLTTALSRMAPHAGRGDGERAAQAASTPRWNWLIERFDTTGARVRVLAPGGGLDLSAHAVGENLGAGAYWSPLRVGLAGDAAIARFDGTVRLTPGLTIEGHLTADRIDFAAVARAAALPWADLVQSGRATADLTVGFEPAAANAPPLYARGTIQLSDAWIAGPDPNAFTVGAAGVDLTLDGFSRRPPSSGRDRGGSPTRVKFSAVDVEAPFALLTRTADGWILPPFTPPTETAPDPLSAARDTAPETPEIILGNVRCTGGSVTVFDLVPGSAVTWDIRRVRGTASAVSLPALTFDRLQLRGSDPRFGDLGLAGSRSMNTTTFGVSGQGMPLAATAPYLQLAGLPYAFGAGKGAFMAIGTMSGARWSADAVLTLQEPVLNGSDTALQQAIGMAVPSALELLRDQSGEVTLQLALASPVADGGDSYAERVATGVRAALRGAAEETRAATAVNMAPLQVRFRPGQVELTAAALEGLARIAELVGSHPDLVVELAAETSFSDRRWLAEQALYEQLGDSGGFRSVLRAFGMHDARDRIRSALAARARGAPGVLERDDEVVLTQLLAEAPPIDDAQLVALGETRLARIVGHLADRYGLTDGRVVVHGVARQNTPGHPAVRLQVSLAGAPAIGSGSSPAADSVEPPAPPRRVD